MSESIADVAHLIVAGHVAHADVDCHDDDGAEHGCSGAFHACPCHAAVVFDVDGDARPRLRAHFVAIDYLRGNASAGPPGHRTSVERPPSA